MKWSRSRWFGGRRTDPSECRPLERKLDLICGACGKVDRYRVGTVVVDTDRFDGQPASLDEAMGFTAYVLCSGCSAGGPWRLEPKSASFVATALARPDARQDHSPVRFGEMHLFDGTAIRYPTEGEEHLKRMIDADPEDGYIWNRLGNLYRIAGRLDLAKEAYRAALLRNEADIESHYSLGAILSEEGAFEASAGHFHGVLKHAWERKDIKRQVLRAVVRNALNSLFWLHGESGGKIEVFPKRDPKELAKLAPTNEVLNLEIRELDLSADSDCEELVSMVLRERRRSKQRLFGGRSRASAGAAGPEDSGLFSSFALERPWPASTLQPRWPGRLPPALARSGAVKPRNGPCPCGSGRKFKNCCGR